MAEDGGKIEHEPIARGIQVEVRNIDDILLFATSPFTDGDTTPLQDTEFPPNPLVNRVKSGFISNDPDEGFHTISTEIYFADQKKAQDGGYYSEAKRNEMRANLLKAGFTSKRIEENKEYFSGAPRVRGTFFIDYGFRDAEQNETKLRAAYEENQFDADIDTILDGGQVEDDPIFTRAELIDHGVDSFRTEGKLTNPRLRIGFEADTHDTDEYFRRKVAGYGKICEGVFKALYATEGLPEPDMNIILQPPVTKDIVDA